MSGSPAERRLLAWRQRLQQAQDRVLPPAELHPARLHTAMRYACEGGKRLRAALVYAAGEMLAAPPAALDAAACAVELVHSYSLVHDDLPAMDDDDLRRGRAAVHRHFDEATAILAGDALLTLAFGVLARAPEVDAEQRVQMVQLLADAAGSRGMVGGQAIDLGAEGCWLTLAELEALHLHKTGALIRCCLLLACRALPQTDTRAAAALDTYGKAVGLAYQIQDDILDIEGHAQSLGKTIGKDEAALKSTYPSIMGLRAAKERAAELFGKARAALDVFGDRAEPLACVLDLIEQRER